ncbi:hypothetical protein J6E39_09455 [bacterium]|nr:hypothetical protein [bacterium]
MIKADNNIPTIVSERFLKDGRSVSVFKKDGKTVGWKRYSSNGQAITCEAQYKAIKGMSGVAKYDRIGTIKSFLKINSNKRDENFIDIKKLDIDFENVSKHSHFLTLRKNQQGKWILFFKQRCFNRYGELLRRTDKNFFKSFKL